MYIFYNNKIIIINRVYVDKNILNAYVFYIIYIVYRSLIGKTLVFETQFMCSNHIENINNYIIL